MLTRARHFYGWFSLLLVLGTCCLAVAHPMGNFSVNHYSRITLESDRIRVNYFIDLAEIPTYQELQQANLSTTSIDPGPPVVTNYVALRGAGLARGLVLEVNGTTAPLHLVSSGVIFPVGAGGLPTMKMGFVYEAAYPSTTSSLPTFDRQHVSLHYSDRNYPGHSGWKEIVALVSNGTLMRSSVPTTDRSMELSNYPTDLLTSPPQDVEASLVATLKPLPPAVTITPPSRLTTRAALSAPSSNRGKGASERAMKPSAIRSSLVPSQPASVPSSQVHLQPNRQQTPRSRFTELIEAQDFSAWFLFTAALIAVGLGGLHALEPGHGKTIVAAYLVGSKGTARHALLLGLVVTISHTAGVFALGAITLYASRYIVPEQLYPWLGAFSGVTIAALGCNLLLRRLTGTAADHSHIPGSSHAHWKFWTRRADVETGVDQDLAVSPPQSVSLAQLFTLGITGGIIPCPAALIVLLSAFALHRVGLGFFLIVAFSVGLASVLIGFGMLMVYARHLMSRLQVDGPLTRRWLPVVSSSFITVLGMTLTVQSLSSVHLDIHLPAAENLGPILFVTGLGLILGMRHSTDPDHVVAISTIVSKQRSIRNAAVIGSVWGLGHTITIFIVGSLIILFGIEIPPRLGLSMEFSVAIMLVLLGVLNLTGVIQKVTAMFTPASATPNDTESLTPSKTRSPKIEKLFQNPVDRLGVYQCVRPLVIGLVHGLAGSAAVALLVLSTIHSPVWATVYLLIFGAGTMIGMMCMTAMIAIPLAVAGGRFTKLGRYLGTASGMASLCFGSFLIYQLGFLGGLFTSHPQWTPR